MQNQAIIYNNGELELKVSVENETIWASINDIATIFDIDRSVVSRHIKNIFKDKELDKKVVCANFAHTTKHGALNSKTQTKIINYYNLDIVLAVGYRTNSLKAIKFRKWATQVLKQYISNGYVINSDKITHERFKELENNVSILQNQMKLLKNKTIKPSEGIFYDGQIFDAYEFVSNIVKSAKKEIILLDNYVDETVLTLFSKNQNVKVTIYTKTITKQLKLDLEKYNAQYNPVTIKTFKNSHDRFLIIDKMEVYHIGASLKDLGKKWFAFSKMDIKSVGILDRLGNI